MSEQRGHTESEPMQRPERPAYDAGIDAWLWYERASKRYFRAECERLGGELAIAHDSNAQAAAGLAVRVAELEGEVSKLLGLLARTRDEILHSVDGETCFRCEIDEALGYVSPPPERMPAEMAASVRASALESAEKPS